jgi:membrane-associated phospholipid phosphatase
MKRKTLLLIGALAALIPFPAEAQSPTDMAALKGLAPVTVLSKTSEGTAALAANYTVTGGIQTGAIRQSTLLPFAEQRQQALRDAFITAGNLAQLSDGLGTTLGAGYLARAHCSNWTHCTDLSQAVANVIAYANAISGINSNSGKYFFANATTDGKTPVSAEAMEILKANGGDTDVFGKNYGLPAGTLGADAYGNSRPFQTEPSTSQIVGPDYLNVPADNRVYNRGPIMNLINSPSYPSGHTTYGYTGSLVLAILVPERYQEMIARGAEYGNDRILMGAHYAMDVMGGRTLALYDMAHLLANDPVYTGRTMTGVTTIKDFQAAIKVARADATRALEAACGKTMPECAREDIGRLSNPAANEAFYADTQTYNLPVVYPKTASTVEDIGKLDKDAGYLLTAAFPSLTLEQANRILTETEGPGGGFLDDGSSFGVYSRINLYAAAGKAVALASGQSSSTRHFKNVSVTAELPWYEMWRGERPLERHENNP